VKIVIPGGSGQVGTILARAFHGDGHDVVVLSRGTQECSWRVVEWDGATLGRWQREIDGADVIVNLAGRSVNCRYTAANRDQIMQSRVLSTRVVGQAIAADAMVLAEVQATDGSSCRGFTTRTSSRRFDG
jgi:uncharacterized protein